jgi:hypothetical protein
MKYLVYILFNDANLKKIELWENFKVTLRPTPLSHMIYQTQLNLTTILCANILYFFYPAIDIAFQGHPAKWTKVSQHYKSDLSCFELETFSFYIPQNNIFLSLTGFFIDILSSVRAETSLCHRVKKLLKQSEMKTTNHVLLN